PGACVLRRRQLQRTGDGAQDDPGQQGAVVETVRGSGHAFGEFTAAPAGPPEPLRRKPTAGPSEPLPRKRNPGSPEPFSRNPDPSLPEPLPWGARAGVVGVGYGARVAIMTVQAAVEWVVAALSGTTAPAEIGERLAPRLTSRGDIAKFFA